MFSKTKLSVYNPGWFFIGVSLFHFQQCRKVMRQKILYLICDKELIHETIKGHAIYFNKSQAAWIYMQRSFDDLWDDILISLSLYESDKQRVFLLGRRRRHWLVMRDLSAGDNVRHPAG